MIQSACGADIISDARETMEVTVLVTVSLSVARDPVPAFATPRPTLGRRSGDGQDAPGRRSGDRGDDRRAVGHLPGVLLTDLTSA